MQSKKKVLVIMLLAMVCLVLGCAACQTDALPSDPVEPEQLSAPQDLKVYSDEFSWSEVEHANGYIVEVDGDKGTASSTFFSLPYFEETVTVNLRVKACGDGINYEDSDWAQLIYTYEKPTSGLQLTLLPDGEGYSVSRGYANLNGRVVIPDAYNGLPILEIAEDAFISDRQFSIRKELKEVRLPERLQKIQKGAFWYTGLTSVSIPDTVEYIEESAFCGCEWLKELKLPKGLKRLEGSFAKTAITEVVIPDGCEYLGTGVFNGCSKLEHISVPDSVTHMGMSVFGGTPWYEAQPEGYITVGRILYEYKGKLPENTVIDRLPEGVIAIAGGAFYRQTHLVEFSVDSAILTIGENAFESCTRLARVRLPDTLTVLEKYLFFGCWSLSEFVIPSSVRDIATGVFYGCNSLSELVIPSSVRDIATSVFYGCNSLNGFIIPKSVSKLNQRAFHSDTKDLTFYMEAESCPEDFLYGIQQNKKTPWHCWFPIIWGCELSEQKDYVVSFLKREDRLENFGEKTVFEPKRAGYLFCGWTSEQNGTVAQYSCETITEAPEGTRLYAIWQRL